MKKEHVFKVTTILLLVISLCGITFNFMGSQLYANGEMEVENNTNEMSLKMGGVGSSISETFPDAAMASAVANKIAAGNVNYILTDLDIVNATDWSVFPATGIRDISGIEYFVNLTKLSIVNQINLLNIVPLSSLTNLEQLNLEGSRSGGSYGELDITPIQNLTNLKELNLSLCKIDLTGLNTLSTMTQLESLNLYGGRFTSPYLSRLNTLINLKDLNLGSNFGLGAFDNINALASLPNLQTLILNNNHFTQLSDQFIKFPALITLDLSSNDIAQITSLFAIQNIKNLNLNNNNIVDISPLNTITALDSLGLAAQRNILNSISYTNPVVLQNMVKDETGDALAPIVISNEGVYEGTEVVWTKVENRVSLLVYIFSKDVTIGGVTTPFYGEVSLGIIPISNPVLSANPSIRYEVGDTPSLSAFYTAIDAKITQAGNVVVGSFSSDFMTQVDLHKAGVYSVNVSAEYLALVSNSVLVQVVVSDENSIINEANKEMIRAENFEVPLNQVENSNFVTLANAQAWNINNADIVPVALSSEKPNKVGVYPVTFSTATGTTKSVYVNVIDENTLIDDMNNEMISAHNFSVSMTDLASANFVASANAQAWNTNDGSRVEVMLENEKPNSVGDYEVVFSTAKGTTKKIQVIVYDDEKVDPETHEVLFANNVVISKQDLHNADFISLSKAEAWNVNTNEQVNLYIKTGSIIESTLGKHTLTFSTEQGTQKTIYVFVVDENSVVSNHYVLYANDFELQYNELKDLTLVSAKTLAKVSAFEIETGNNVQQQVSVDETQLELIKDTKKAGIFDLTFRVNTKQKESVMKTIQVSVNKEGETLHNPSTLDSTNVVSLVMLLLGSLVLSIVYLKKKYSK